MLAICQIWSPNWKWPPAFNFFFKKNVKQITNQKGVAFVESSPLSDVQKSIAAKFLKSEKKIHYKEKTKLLYYFSIWFVNDLYLHLWMYIYLGQGTAFVLSKVCTEITGIFHKKGIESYSISAAWFMDRNSGSEPTSPLLRKGSSSSRLFGGSGRRVRIGRRNSFNSLRNDFVAQLPDKVRSGFDSESLEVDFSRTTLVGEGFLSILYDSLCLFGGSENGEFKWNA